MSDGRAPRRKGPLTEAQRIEVEAGRITDPEKSNKSRDHRGQFVKASRGVRITIRSQYPNSSGNPGRPPAGTELRGDNVEIEAREIYPVSRRGGLQRTAAKRSVKIYGVLYNRRQPRDGAQGAVGRRRDR